MKLTPGFFQQKVSHKNNRNNSIFCQQGNNNTRCFKWICVLLVWSGLIDLKYSACILVAKFSNLIKFNTCTHINLFLSFIRFHVGIRDIKVIDMNTLVEC